MSKTFALAMIVVSLAGAAGVKEGLQGRQEQVYQVPGSSSGLGILHPRREGQLSRPQRKDG